MGVRQGRLLSLLLFLVMLDWVIRTLYANSGKGSQWTLMNKLEDLDYADDLTLLSHRLQDKEKTKVLRINNKQ
uniref:Reverse transcriptase domain-containing protein n=1 Tax=Octopus bimaculoides TaxID=37653 RepID=A0A0L8GZM5_OCTBM